MSEITEQFNNDSAAQFNRDVSKTFLGENKYDHGSITNSSYANLSLTEGMVLGRNSVTKEVGPLDSSATNGLQYPIGIVRGNYVIPYGETWDVAYCIGGRVAEEKITFPHNADAMDTIVEDKILRDRIASDTLGIQIVRTASELTGYDNNLV